MTAQQAVESRTVEELVSEIKEICREMDRREILLKVGGLGGYALYFKACLPEETARELLSDAREHLKSVRRYIADERPVISRYVLECAASALKCAKEHYRDLSSAQGQIHSSAQVLRVANSMLEKAREEFAKGNFSEAQRLAQEAVYRR